MLRRRTWSAGAANRHTIPLLAGRGDACWRSSPQRGGAARRSALRILWSTYALARRVILRGTAMPWPSALSAWATARLRAVTEWRANLSASTDSGAAAESLAIRRALRSRVGLRRSMRSPSFSGCTRSALQFIASGSPSTCWNAMASSRQRQRRHSWRTAGKVFCWAALVIRSR